MPGLCYKTVCTQHLDIWTATDVARDLPPSNEDWVLEHMEACAECCDWVDFFRKLYSVTASMGEIAVPESWTRAADEIFVAMQSSESTPLAKECDS